MTSWDRIRTADSPPTEEDSSHTHWTLALAGGEGTRLSQYVTRRFGHHIPKQYCRLLGSRSMIEHTLDRLNQLTPPSRTFTVIGTRHDALARPQLAGRSHHVLCQPASRDTGFAVFVALAYMKRWTPNAVVTITPTDHYVAPALTYVAQVKKARDIAARLRDTVVILGAAPRKPDPELGYLALGDRLVEVPQVRHVDRFVEKPCVAVAADLIGRGALWNTMVTCATVEALWDLGRATEPQLLDILDTLVPIIGTKDEEDALHWIYRAYLPVSFSTDILQRAPERLAAIEMRGCDWSDWGCPDRIESVLALRRMRALLPVRKSG
ncbi:MAG: putative Mannose-phosphate guanylyltransferase [Myxococcales bacterium]|nr:putative Mannose-phosphate guanylyltransferase [Myxococcales bacterium]